MKSLPENALLGIVVLGFLAFLGLLGSNLLASFTGTPEEEHHAPAHHSDDMTKEEYGYEVFKASGCMGCHNLEIEVAADEGTIWEMQGGILGPSLNNVAVRWRNDRENLTEKIINPAASLPNSYMPSFAHLSEEELDALVSFLLTLDGSRQPEVTYAEPKDVSRFTQAQIDAGLELFQSQGCIGCHSATTIDLPLTGGAIGPNLSYEAHRDRSDEWQKEHLQNPHSVYVMGEPNTQVICSVSNCMLSYSSLSDEQLNNLVAFIQSLQ